MNPTARWITVLGAIALFAVAGILQWQTARILEELRPPIPRLPINLDLGVMKTPEFMVASEGSYSITLYLDRDPGNRKIDCLLGVAMDMRDCAGIDSPVLLSWSLFTDGALTQQGKSRPKGAGSWSRRRVGNTFGEFLATPGRKYVLHIESLRDASALAPVSPAISVGRSARESKGLFATASLYSIGAMAIAAVAAILVLTAAIAYFFGLKKSSSPVG